jgi:hypothetical protein
MAWADTLEALDAALDPALDGRAFVGATSFDGLSPSEIGDAIAKAPKLSDFAAAVAKVATARPSGDIAATGKAIRARLVYAGRVVDGVESAEHTSWREAAERLVEQANKVADRVQPCGCGSSSAPATTTREALRLALQRLDRAIPVIDWPPLYQRAAALLGSLRDYPSEPQKYAEGQPDAQIVAQLVGGPDLRALLTETEREAREWIRIARREP